MVKYIGVCVFVLLLCGCGSSGSKSPGNSSARISQWATTPIPPPPPAPDAGPTDKAISEATTEVGGARTNVQQVLTVAESNPAAKDAVPPLVSADTHLATAQQKLGDAKSDLNELRARLEATEKAHKDAEASLAKDIASLKSAASTAMDQKQKEIQDLQDENTKLKDAQLNHVQLLLYMIGSFLCLGSIAMFLLRVYSGFAIGSTLGAFMAPTGMAVLGFAKLLPKLSEYAEWGIIAAGCVGVLALALSIYHTFQHVPVAAATVQK